MIAPQVSFTGELGYELCFPAAYQMPVVETLWAVGSRLRRPGVLPLVAALECREARLQLPLPTGALVLLQP